ncbi:conjugative transposon protein TraM [Galbibacter sp. EGI 63066]|uniref:conjugative transposon protein TraM n=1 Tax=Galbibacter sp. EGI 63066 TaxID=2993559 RepID=UPI00224994F5|nr:conjugative transposon protein TraM [Galbibacter sp. EGI 63066]MCX2680759.1 conjugative transposon protein TraM [Galbibacter sp. EGI 63066]
MEKNKDKKSVVRVTEGSPNETADVLQENTQNKAEKLKKPMIFILMGVVFLGCMYLIFKPSEKQQEEINVGLNDAVPQATNEGLPEDKGKAYEQEMFKKKVQEKRNAMMSLSDYWNNEEEKEIPQAYQEEEETTGYGTPPPHRKQNPTLNSYRYAQNTLSSFYEDDNHETQELQEQIEELKAQLEEKDEPQVHTVEDQLALMEESYKMAAKYLPANTQTNQVTPASSSTEQEYFVAFTSVKKSPVSRLYREPSDSTFMANWTRHRNRDFYTSGTTGRVVQPKNSIKACIQETQTVIGETRVRLRLLEPAQTPNHSIPKGTVLSANAKFQKNRLQLNVKSIELEGNIIPVDISIYDLDGQQGLYVPYSPEINALSEMAGNMGQTSGASLMMTQSAGQQVAADLSRGVVQGISGYFSKKVKTPKITLKAGYQVFLVSKN